MRQVTLTAKKLSLPQNDKKFDIVGLWNVSPSDSVFASVCQIPRPIFLFSRSVQNGVIGEDVPKLGFEL